MAPIQIDAEAVVSFSECGFIGVSSPILSSDFVDELNYGLERAIRGQYDDEEGKRGGGVPDKSVRRIKAPLPPPPPYRDQAPPPPLGFSGNHQNVKTLQIVNVWKCSTVFEKLVLSQELGKVRRDGMGFCGNDTLWGIVWS